MNKRIFSEEWAELAYFSMENSSEMIFWVKEDGHFYYVNPAVSKNLGYSIKELMKMEASDILADYTEEERLSLRKEIDTRGRYVVRALLSRKDGTTISVESVNNSIKINEQVVNCAFCRDISDRVKYEKELLTVTDILKKENENLRSIYKLTDHLNIVGTSRKLTNLLNRAKKFAGNDSPVLILGESGVGKESIARFIHLNSPRKHKELITLNCATLTEHDILSRLFGHVKGAYTGSVGNRTGLFELANDSTLFLDEVGELSLDIQAILLRILQSGEFYRMGSNKVQHTNARIIGATNRDLKAMTKEKTFRHDLLSRINVLPLKVPPLRSRATDIPLLIDYKLSLLNRKYGTKLQPPSKEDLKVCKAYSFPGNIRELFNIVERAYFIRHEGFGRLELPPVLFNEDEESTNSFLSLEQNERRHIIKALKECNGKIGGPDGVAELLKVNRNTLVSRMKKLNITKWDA